MKLRGYIGDRAFYKMALTVAVPIMLQNFITNLVSMLDNLMVGSIGTEEMSGVSIVNQLIFIFNLTVFGALSGAGIFTAQYFGKNDNAGIRYTFRYKMAIALIITAVALGIFMTLGDNLISLYLHDVQSGENIDETRQFARQYLDVILIGLLPFAITQTYASTLRETGQTLAPMVIGFIAVLTNCIFNYLLIFGKFGFPLLGVRGAAIATNISRFAECALIIAYSYRKRHKYAYFKGALRSFRMPSALFRDITFKGMPLLVNEFLWATGMSLLSVGYSYHGLSVVAGYSISSTVMNLFNIAFLSLGSSIGIIIGKYLGANEFDRAVEDVKKLIFFSFTLSVVLAVTVFSVGGLIPRLYNTTDESKAYAEYFIRVCACFMPVNAFANASYFTLRSGGKTLATFLFDSVFVCVFSVPVAFSLYFLFHLSIWVIFPIVQSLEILKDVIGFVLIKKRVWVNNIVA